MIKTFLTLFQSRELEIGIYWKDYRNMCAVKFLRLEDFLDDLQHGMVIHLEPQGILFAEVGFSSIWQLAVGINVKCR